MVPAMRCGVFGRDGGRKVWKGMDREGDLFYKTSFLPLKKLYCDVYLTNGGRGRGLGFRPGKPLEGRLQAATSPCEVGDWRTGGASLKKESGTKVELTHEKREGCQEGTWGWEQSGLISGMNSPQD